MFGIDAQNQGSRSEQNARTECTDELTYEFAEGESIPAFVRQSGLPYTGTVSVSQGIADWTGTYVDGRRHGVFRILLGDRMNVVMEYRNGTRIVG